MVPGRRELRSPERGPDLRQEGVSDFARLRINCMRSWFKGRILTIPNLLSAVRILLIPAFMWAYLRQDDMRLTVILLGASGLTDVLDGFIARRFHMISDFGKALDPLADKLTQFAMLCCLVLRFPRLLWLIIVLGVKESFVASTELLVMHRTEMVLGSEWHGKLTTVLLYAVMLLHLLWLDLPEQLSWSLEWLCIALLLLSGVLYGIRNIRAARAAAASHPDAPDQSTEEKTA